MPLPVSGGDVLCKAEQRSEQHRARQLAKCCASCTQRHLWGCEREMDVELEHVRFVLDLYACKLIPNRQQLLYHRIRARNVGR
jgi:hypothetical protein